MTSLDDHTDAAKDLILTAAEKRTIDPADALVHIRRRVEQISHAGAATVTDRIIIAIVGDLLTVVEQMAERA